MHKTICIHSKLSSEILALRKFLRNLMLFQEAGWGKLRQLFLFACHLPASSWEEDLEGGEGCTHTHTTLLQMNHGYSQLTYWRDEPYTILPPSSPGPKGSHSHVISHRKLCLCFPVGNYYWGTRQAIIRRVDAFSGSLSFLVYKNIACL